MKKLVIAPHADDEVLGCASVLDEDTFVYYVGVDEFHVVPREERLREVEAVADFFGFRYDWGRENTVNNYRLQDLIPKFEKLLGELKPVEFFIPFHGSYNQDHRVVYHAALVASRPHDRNHFVSRVFMYEQPDVLWTASGFCAQYFVPVDLQRKIEGLQLHKSQMRDHRAVDLVESMSRIRGEQAGVRFAEGFQVLRFLADPPVAGRDRRR